VLALRPLNEPDTPTKADPRETIVVVPINRCPLPPSDRCDNIGRRSGGSCRRKTLRSRRLWALPARSSSSRPHHSTSATIRGGSRTGASSCPLHLAARRHVDDDTHMERRSGRARLPERFVLRAESCRNTPPKWWARRFRRRSSRPTPPTSCRRRTAC
jgi:hypothetical protein